jgi:hypothetical protein
LVDVNNWLFVGRDNSLGFCFFRVIKCVAGVTTTLVSDFQNAGQLADNCTIIASVDVAGNVGAGLGPIGSTSIPMTAFANDPALATGGALDDGYVGVYDAYVEAKALIREYDNFACWVPVRDAAVYSLQKATLSTDGMYRIDSSGSAYGPVSRVVGNLPRLPAGGLENRPTELFLKGSRGNLTGFPDSAIDDIAAKVYTQRSWLMVPGAI